MYNDHRAADNTISEFLLKLQAIWYKTKTQTELLRKLWNSLDFNYQASQHLLLSVLENKLEEAVRQCSRVVATKSQSTGFKGTLLKRGSLRKVKFVILVKDNLEKLLVELKDWHGLYDPSWFLLSRAPSQSVDQGLESQPKEGAVRLLAGLRKSAKELSFPANAPCRPISTKDFLEGRILIKYSSAAIARVQGQTQKVIVDTMPSNPFMDTEGTTRTVVALARALSRMDPSTFGLLRCCGVINKVEEYEFVFEMPKDLKRPKSLRDLLRNDRPSLNVRFDMARQLANSVLYLHAAGFVHKNIRPEIILVFDNDGVEQKSSFLVGFENFRGIKDSTFKIGDGLPERELYRHPERQGYDLDRRYVMQDDIYSLGVCLLEIGLWDSFVQRNVRGDTIVEFGGEGPIGNWRARAFSTKRIMLKLANEALPRCTGQRFSDVVERCLTVLDGDTTWDQVDEKGSSEIDIGVEYIENILVQLHEILI